MSLDLKNLQLQYPLYLLYGAGNSQICTTESLGKLEKNSVYPGSYPVIGKQNFRAGPAEYALKKQKQKKKQKQTKINKNKKTNIKPLKF